MSKKIIIGVFIVFLMVVGMFVGIKVLLPSITTPASADFENGLQIIKLPEPVYESNTSIEEALKNRRSVRVFNEEPIKVQQLSQLLWAAQGVSHQETQYRTAPSAYSVYPLKIYVVTSNIDGLDKGLYGYLPENHELVLIDSQDVKNSLFLAIKQPSVKNAAASIVITGLYDQMVEKVGEKAAPFCVHAEVGHVSQNIYLQAVSLKLGTVSIGGVNDDSVRKVLNFKENEDIFYVMPIGNPK